MIALLLCALLLLSGCRSDQPAASYGAETMRISAILPHNDYGYWTTVANGLNDAAAQLPIDVKIHLPDLNYNVGMMTQLIEQQTAAQVDALVVQGIDDPDYIAALKNAQDQGTLVVLVDTDLSDFDADLYVGTDNYEAGLQMGKNLARVTERKANVAVLSGAPGYPNLEMRLQGICDAVEKYPGIQILRLEYDNYDAMTVMEKYYLIRRESPQIDTLVAIEGTGGQTLGQLGVSEFDHTLVFDYCDESLQGLKNGCFDGILGQQNYEMGVICAEELYRHFMTGSFSQEKIYTSVNWITVDNLEEETTDE